MPTLYVWPLVPLPPPGPPFVFPPFPIGAGPDGACDGTFHDQSYFLSLFDRVIDPSYLDPMKVTPRGGYEVFEALGMLGERVSLAIERFECGSFIIFATGGSLATATVEFTRPTNAGGQFTIKVGSVVTCSKSGRDFYTSTDAVFGASDLGPIVANVVAVAPGYEWNVPGKKFAANGEVLAGEIDTIKSLIQYGPDPALVVPYPPGVRGFYDATVSVAQVADATGGADPMLDGLGADRGLPRQVGEGDPAYRFRLRQLPDVVSPDAIERAVHGLLDPVGATFDFIETWDINYQSCWDCPSPNAGTPSFQDPLPDSPNFALTALAVNNLFVYDDPRPAYDTGRAVPFYNRWLDDIEFRGAFIITVPTLAAMEDCGLAYDDTATVVADFDTGIGYRSYGAWDIPSTFSVGHAGGFDGFDLGVQAVYSGLFNLLQSIKAAGVAAIVELQGE